MGTLMFSMEPEVVSYYTRYDRQLCRQKTGKTDNSTIAELSTLKTIEPAGYN